MRDKSARRSTRTLSVRFGAGAMSASGRLRAFAEGRISVDTVEKLHF
jgi:hypothetical protein